MAAVAAPAAPATKAPRPAVSVVMPLYDKADYVEAAVASVLAQLEAWDEIVVVNDGSTDRGPDLVRAIGDPRIRVIDQANAGGSAARNRGIQAARNGWIAFLDADDLWRPGKLDRQLAILQRAPQLTWAAGGFEQASDERVLARADPMPDAWFQGDGILRDGLAVLAAGRHLWIGTVIARRARLLELDGFDTGLRIGEDVLLCVRLALADPQLAYVRLPVALYRWAVPGSMMQQSIGRSMAEPVDLLDRRLLAIAPTVAPDRAALLHALVRHRVITRAKGLLLSGRPTDVPGSLALAANLGLGAAGVWLRAAAHLPAPLTRLGMGAAIALKHGLARCRDLLPRRAIGAPAGIMSPRLRS